MATILINDKVDDNLVRILNFNHVVIEKHHEINELIHVIKEIDVIIVKSKTKLNKIILDESKKTNKLKLIIRAGVGLDNIDTDYARSLNIKVLNTPLASTNAVAELAFGYLISMSRSLFEANQEMHQSIWNKDKYFGNELEGKTLGIIGLGRIGKKVSKLAEAFGMKIIYYDPFVIDYSLESVSLEMLLSNADYISIHMSSIGENIINKNHLNIIKNGVKIINLARGDLIEEEFIIDGIRSGKIGKIALDVFINEPHINKMFLQHKNIYLTPHIGAQTKEAQEKISNEIIDIIKREFKHV